MMMSDDGSCLAINQDNDELRLNVLKMMFWTMSDDDGSLMEAGNPVAPSAVEDNKIHAVDF